MTEGIKFDRKPYIVTYYKDGKKHTIRRVPPPVLHNMLPKDMVRLNRTKNADWKEGQVFSVKYINPKHPNVIQIEDKKGNSTFVPYFDLCLEDKVAMRNGKLPIEEPINNRYLLWP